MEVKKSTRNIVILPAICIKDMEVECSTAIINRSCENELHMACLWFVKVGCREERGHIKETWYR